MFAIIDTETRIAADSLKADAQIIVTALSGGYSTEAGLTLAMDALERLRKGAPSLAMNLRQLRGQVRRQSREEHADRARLNAAGTLITTTRAALLDAQEHADLAIPPLPARAAR